MLKFIFNNTKKIFAEKVKRSDLDPEIKEIFLGRRTLFSLIGFIVGGILFEKSSTTSTYPWKGEAIYYNIKVGSKINSDAA